MKQTTTFSQFTDSFRDMDRQDNFSYQALRLLFDWFEQYEEETGQEMELDVIAICCEFNESTADELISDYELEGFRSDFNGKAESWRNYGDREADEIEQYLLENTLFVGKTDHDTFVYQAF